MPEKRALLAVAAVVVLGLLLGATTWGYPWTILDTPTFTYTARVILHGGAPYRDSFDVKGPGVHFAFTLAALAFGESARGMRIFEVIWQMATALALFAVACRVWGGVPAGAIAASIYLLAYYSTEWWALAQPDGMVSLPLAIAAWCVMCSEDRAGWVPWFAASFFIGVAALFKLPLGLAGLFVLWASFSPDGWRSFARRAAPMLFGLAAPFAVAAFYLQARGALQDFLFSQFVVAPQYAAFWRATMSGACLRENLLRLSNVSVVALLGFAAAVMLFGWRDSAMRSWKRSVLYVWLGVALLVLVVHGSFLLYHFHSLIAPLALLAAGPASGTLAAPRSSPVLRRLAVAAVLLLLLGSAARQVRRNFLLAEAFRAENFASDYWLRLGHALRDRTSPGDRICIWGNAPVLYLHSQRDSATRFIYMIFFADPFAHFNLKAAFLDEFRAGHPAYFVLMKQHPARACAAMTRIDEFPAYQSFTELRRIIATGYVLEQEDEQMLMYRRADYSGGAGNPATPNGHHAQLGADPPPGGPAFPCGASPVP